MSIKAVRIVDLNKSASQINEQIESATEEYIGFAFYNDEADHDKQVADAESYFSDLTEAFRGVPDAAFAQGTLRIGAKRRLSLFRRLPKEATVLDSSSDFWTAPIYPHGLLCPTRMLLDSGLCFDESMPYVKNELFSLRLAQLFPRHLFVPSCSYRPDCEFEETTTSALHSDEQGWYWESTLPLVDKLSIDGKLPRSAQFGIYYMLIQRFKNNEDMNIKIVFDDNAQTEEYLDQAAEVMRNIEDEVAFCNNVRLWERRKLLYLTSLRDRGAEQKFELREDGPDFSVFLEGSDAETPVIKFSTQTVRIQALRYCKDSGKGPGFDIDFRVECCVPPSAFDVYLRVESNGKTLDVKGEKTPRLAGMTTFFDRVAYTIPSYHAFVPLKRFAALQEISCYALVDNGTRVNMKKLSPWGAWQSRLMAKDEHGSWSIPGRVVRMHKGKLRVERASRFKKMRMEREFIHYLEKEGKASERIVRLRKKYWETRGLFKNRRIWLYYDKGFKGGDNGEFAFSYAAAQQDGIEHAYLIGSDTEDGKRLAAQGCKILEPYSDEAIMYALNAEVIFATHVPVYRKIGLNKQAVEYFKDIMDAKIVRLYHGFPITRDISYTQFYADYAAVAVGSTYEYDLYTNDDNGFRDDQVIKCSMPRYDGLVGERKRQLLFAPTWRPSCRGKVGKNGESGYNPDFVNTKYFKLYDQILSDPKLLETARKTGFKIKMFLHPRMAPQTVDFKSNDVVEALDCTKDTDYVTIMKESDLMVTDYSSVMVDFAYMRRPVVYYQDEALPYWRFTNFDYENIGFGEVCKDPDSLVDILCAYMERDCALDETYRDRINRFFYFDDTNGAKRLYEAVRKMTDK